MTFSPMSRSGPSLRSRLHRSDMLGRRVLNEAMTTWAGVHALAKLRARMIQRVLGKRESRIFEGDDHCLSLRSCRHCAKGSCLLCVVLQVRTAGCAGASAGV